MLSLGQGWGGVDWSTLSWKGGPGNWSNVAMWARSGGPATNIPARAVVCSSNGSNVVITSAGSGTKRSDALPWQHAGCWCVTIRRGPNHRCRCRCRLRWCHPAHIHSRPTFLPRLRCLCHPNPRRHRAGPVSWCSTHRLTPRRCTWTLTRAACRPAARSPSAATPTLLSRASEARADDALSLQGNFKVWVWPCRFRLRWSTRTQRVSLWSCRSLLASTCR
jgi:hypothetical protein